jgi:hypothetical protein
VVLADSLSQTRFGSESLIAESPRTIRPEVEVDPTQQTDEPGTVR